MTMTKEQIRLDEEHRYWAGNSRVPGFSEIAQSFFPSNPYWTERGRDEGTHLHACCALLLEHDLDWQSVDAAVMPRVRGFEKFLADTSFKPADAYVEKPQYEATLGYACTPDWPGSLGNWAVVIEGKRGAKSKIHQLQTAAQKLALRANGFKAEKRYGLYLRDFDYRLEEHTNRADETMWPFFVAAFHAKEFYQ